MIDLNSPIETLSKIGPKSVPKFNRLGIKTIGDLLWHLPSRYEDFSNLIPISDIHEKGQIVTIVGEVRSIETSRAWKRNLTITNAEIEDESGSIRAVWFNQPFIEDQFPEGTIIILSGKVALDKRGLYLSGPSREKLTEDPKHTARLVPIYPETAGITSKYLRFILKPVLDSIKSLEDPLPKYLRDKHGLPDILPTLNAIHFPDNIEENELARKRLAFEELLLFQLRALLDRQNLHQLKAPTIKIDDEKIAEFVSSLPFKLTDDQRIATYEILKDLEKGHPMNRLLNGDVGSGKTVVALISAYSVANEGFQTVFMAPTEILANQHYATAKTLLSTKYDNTLRIGLLTGSEAKQWPIDEITEEKISKKLMQKKIEDGEIDILIGTHAVIQKNISFKNLGFIAIDEQHRFGIAQRHALQQRDTKKITPHLLSMTATPIPRTLALTIYGDLDVSLIKQKPKGRREIKTYLVSGTKREDAHKFIDKEIEKGRQVFVICPRIEISLADQAKTKEGQENKKPTQSQMMWASVKAVEEEYEKLSKKIFPHRKVAMLHGKLKPKEKEQIMSNFKEKKYDIIVSTSVIEVGVDIPNATIMMIESAERFGLAQLHQFRGRVGRGEHQSYCLLFTSDDSVSAGKRLRAMEKTNDGFELAEMDLKIRGPGEFAGVNQSGIPDITMASLTDMELIKKTREEAKELLKNDPELKNHKGLVGELTKMQKIIHFE